jgi:indole-3-glycerol phosphate synthase
MAHILDEIIAHKRTEVAAAKARRPLAEVVAAAAQAPPARDFPAALADGRSARVIAECKRKSPSKGILAPSYDPVALASAYAAGGAAAISVLTDERFFGGELAHLTAVRGAVGVPVLRKDFIIDEYQIYEARAAHADTYLLIAGVLDAARLEALLAVGRSLGMEPLIEAHDAAEVELALATSGRIFGINNRNLKTFSVDLATSRELLALARRGDPGRIVVCESGIKGPSDIELMRGVGYNAFLIGEALVTHSDPRSALQDLIRHR